MSTATMEPRQRTITGFTDSTPLLQSPEKLRARADEDGFLFFKNFLPKDPLLELRRQILEIINKHGLLKKGTNLMDGIGDAETIARDVKLNDQGRKYIGADESIYVAVQCLELFHALPHHPKLISLYEKLFQGPALPHPRNIARILLPYPGAAATPPHQDYIYIQGTHNFWTCWFPLGDCPMELGGLSMLRGSHRENVLDVRRADGAGGFESLLCDLDYAWVQDNYECGDLVTFPSHMVHKALPNQFPDRIRLSCDNRYQAAVEEIEEKSLQPHMSQVNKLTWDDIYKNWKSDKFKYYWKSLDLKNADWDNSVRQLSDKIC